MLMLSLACIISATLQVLEANLLDDRNIQMRIMYIMANRKSVPLDKVRLDRIFDALYGDIDRRFWQASKDSKSIGFFEPAATRIPKARALLNQLESRLNDEFIIFLAKQQYYEMYPHLKPSTPLKFYGLGESARRFAK
jgi:hypothetical protein